MTAHERAHRFLCGLFVATTGLIYLAAASPAETRGLRYVYVHTALSALMMFVLGTSRDASAADRRWTLASGILARLILIACPAFTSVDVIRYLWDGHAILSGLDPYRLAPDQVPMEAAFV
jgi:hypothetical protein